MAANGEWRLVTERERVAFRKAIEGEDPRRWAKRRESCTHPLERRQRQLFGSGHYCPVCNCVLTTDGPEQVRITSYKETWR